MEASCGVYETLSQNELLATDGFWGRDRHIVVICVPKGEPKQLQRIVPSCGHTGVPIKISGLQSKTQRIESRKDLWEELRWGLGTVRCPNAPYVQNFKEQIYSIKSTKGKRNNHRTGQGANCASTQEALPTCTCGVWSGGPHYVSRRKDRVNGRSTVQM